MSRRPIAFNNSSKSNNSIKKNKVEIGLATDNYASNPGGLTWFNGPDSTNQYVIYSDTYSLGMTTLANAKPVCWGSGDMSDANILRMINGLPTRNNQAPFTTIASALSWVASSSVFNVVSGALDNIVTNGLVINLDASQKASYPGSGNTWYNLAGSENGTIINGTTYGSSNNGIITFDGVDDAVEIYGYNWSHTQVTVCAFIKPATDCPSGDNNIVTIENSFEYRYNNRGDGTASVWYASNPWAWFGSGTITLGQWQMVTFRHNTTTNIGDIWANGSQIFSQAINGGIATRTDNIKIMGRYCCAGSPAKGDLGAILIYNRPLSNSEIIQNFNALKTKYGL
jgi:hypothetical protein